VMRRQILCRTVMKLSNSSLRQAEFDYMLRINRRS